MEHRPYNRGRRVDPTFRYVAIVFSLWSIVRWEVTNAFFILQPLGVVIPLLAYLGLVPILFFAVRGMILAYGIVAVDRLFAFVLLKGAAESAKINRELQLEKERKAKEEVRRKAEREEYILSDKWREVKGLTAAHIKSWEKARAEVIVARAARKRKRE